MIDKELQDIAWRVCAGRMSAREGAMRTDRILDGLRITSTSTTNHGAVTWQPLQVIRNEDLLRCAEDNPPPDEWWDEDMEGL